MKKRVGFPRALLFYKYSVLWTTFFQELGAEIIISPETNKIIKDLGVKIAPDEDCYSTKLYFGHTLYLKDEVDYLFIPRLGSDHEVNVGCPKFIALAEVLRSMFPDIPKIIMPFFSMAKEGHGRFKILRIIFSIGFRFTINPFRILIAGKRAFDDQLKYEKGLKISEEELQKWENSEISLHDLSMLEQRETPLRIALVGHSYVINDGFSSVNIKNLLLSKGIDLITPEQMPKNLIEKQMEKLDYNMYFNYAREILGTTMHFIENNSIDGILQIIIFSCGPDSIIGEMTARYSSRKPGTPLLQLVIDELSSETGILTRIEAFLDMIERKNKYRRKEQICHLHSLISDH
ncbi:MAG: acyl-CoA dehydratase activase-related protein [Candidatus Heimdallarchaeaceae archaeon]|jgi:predicted nucleotide-binding protein (sugar kinase/HSP70/actin superfamily)